MSHRLCVSSEALRRHGFLFLLLSFPAHCTDIKSAFTSSLYAGGNPAGGYADGVGAAAFFSFDATTTTGGSQMNLDYAENYIYIAEWPQSAIRKFAVDAETMRW